MRPVTLLADLLDHLLEGLVLLGCSSCASPPDAEDQAMLRELLHVRRLVRHGVLDIDRYLRAGPAPQAPPESAGATPVTEGGRG